MLFNLLTSLIDQYSILNVFKYLTFRTGLSVLTSLIIVFIIGGPLIKIFSENMITGPIRQDGPIDHIVKKTGTPTMGGVIIIIGITSSTLLWADLSNIYVWTLMFVSLSLGGLGFLDDIYVDSKYRRKGIGEKLIHKLNEISNKNNWGLVRWVTRDDNTKAKSLYDKIAKKTNWDLYELT